VKSHCFSSCLSLLLMKKKDHRADVSTSSDLTLSTGITGISSFAMPNAVFTSTGTSFANFIDSTVPQPPTGLIDTPISFGDDIPGVAISPGLRIYSEPMHIKQLTSSLPVMVSHSDLPTAIAAPVHLKGSDSLRHPGTTTSTGSKYNRSIAAHQLPHEQLPHKQILHNQILHNQLPNAGLKLR
jgi:hypothetical protein